MKTRILVLVLLSASLVAAASHKQAVEFKVAGLRPGSDSIEKAYSRFHKDLMLKNSPPNLALWSNPCTQQMLAVTFDTYGTIWEVKIEPAPPTNIIFDCDSKAYSRSVRARMGGTGRGLVFRDSCSRVQQVYGAPQHRRSPLTSKDDDQVFAYDFDEGNGSLLTLEITCDSVRSEVETIKLTVSGTPKP
jgi:hypothetical protein